jgi:hypothetical protein
MITLKLESAELRRVLGNALLFAPKDDTLPSLCVVRFDVRPEALTIVATNRYVLSHERPNVAEIVGERESFSMTVANVKELIRLLPRNSASLTTVTFDSGGRKITVDIEGDRTTTMHAADDTFPAWRGLVPDPFTPGQRATVAFGAEWLGQLAKVDSGTKEKAVLFEFQDEPEGKRRAVRVRIGATFEAVVAQVQILDAA